jgi:hypothetical protein
VTVKPLTPSFSQQFQNLELAGSLSGGDVVEARVVAMLEGGKVRLAIHGQTRTRTMQQSRWWLR